MPVENLVQVNSFTLTYFALLSYVPRTSSAFDFIYQTLLGFIFVGLGQKCLGKKYQ